MNPQIVIALVEIAISLAHSLGKGSVQGDATTAKSLLDIINKGVEAYQEHTGEPLDPNLIRPETTV